MQVLQQGKQIEEQTTKDFLLEIQADKYCWAILESATEFPKSAKQLSHECNMPISTAYRRVEQLYDHKFLAISGTISEDGKKLFLYKSKIRAIMSSFNKGLLEVQIVPNTGMPAN